MNKLTVFTPTYNRAHLLPRVYESLKNQTSNNFIWMVIDDGSSDGTDELVRQWQREATFEIQYLYKPNEGMHSAHNVAYANITTPFNVCIDSDDYMPPNAVEIICLAACEIADDDDFCGLIGLDADFNNALIGTKIPKELQKVKLNELYQLHRVKGDKKLVYKTEHIKKIPPYPMFAGEKFVPLDYKYLLLDQNYYLKPLNEVLVIVEYQDDGSTRNMLRQYRRHPKGFAFSRISRVDFGITWKEKAKNAVHLVSSSLFVNDMSLWLKTKHTALVLCAIPAGVVLNLYIRLKTQKKP
ncbi:probable beta-glycosyltransferase [Flavobacteriaceae bacterium 3519-10]|nr:probable beta-glycosyltransferase [Flavobacteriaceae bacterium 3519-10]